MDGGICPNWAASPGQSRGLDAGLPRHGCFSQALPVFWGRPVTTSKVTHGPGVSAVVPSHDQKPCWFWEFSTRLCWGLRKPLQCHPLEGPAVAVCTPGRTPTRFDVMTFLPENQNHNKTYLSQIQFLLCPKLQMFPLQWWDHWLSISLFVFPKLSGF